MADEADLAAVPNTVVREFVAGGENRLAAATIQRLLEIARSAGQDGPAAKQDTAVDNGEAATSESRPHPNPRPEGAGALCPFPEGEGGNVECLSPMVLYGVPGTGKSHMVHGLAEAWTRLRPEETVVLISASEFARQYAEAVDQRMVSRWRSRFRSADLLVLEDLIPISTKPAAQCELLHTLDALADRGSLAVVTSRLSPSEMPNLLAGLQSRLMAGLCITLVLPEVDARRQILAKLCTDRKLALSDGTLGLMARSLPLPAPALSGVLANLELAARSAGRPLDKGFVQAYLVQRSAARQPPLRAIAAQTARYFALRVVELRSPSRRRGVVLARDVAMYLARQLTSKSLKQIGDYFGGRDHTTVLHGCRKTESLMRSDSETFDAVYALRQGLALG